MSSALISSRSPASCCFPGPYMDQASTRCVSVSAAGICLIRSRDLRSMSRIPNSQLIELLATPNPTVMSDGWVALAMPVLHGLATRGSTLHVAAVSCCRRASGDNRTTPFRLHHEHVGFEVLSSLSCLEATVSGVA